ncbi:hypothetical protein ACFLZM_08120 [Thermodesulfobacteriota bacterium]
MKKLIIVIALIVAGLHYINPTVEEHKNKISASFPEYIDVKDEKVLDKIWKDLKYIDIFVCSATQSRWKNTLVSVGITRFVLVVDDRWPFIKKPAK